MNAWVRNPIRGLLLFLSVFCVVQVPVMAQSVSESGSSDSSLLPTGERWLEHVEKGLRPFWMMDTAKGTPIGNFPTFRCDNGALLNTDAPCNELNQD
ncbi:N-acylglucosamine 2-epimerase, partial [Photobacterium sp. OFAV2-7]|nr:N-acylglucosamine 2-epimerase [Photobacterium sp. OFAV2-7]